MCEGGCCFVWVVGVSRAVVCYGVRVVMICLLCLFPLLGVLWFVFALYCFDWSCYVWCVLLVWLI